MKISLRSEYALRAIFDLAAQPPGELVKAAEIADRQIITRKLLELILADLKMGGFVCARRGSDGGYRLAKPADQITVGEVLAFVEEIRPPKRREPGPFSELWSRIDSKGLLRVGRSKDLSGTSDPVHAPVLHSHEFFG